MSPALDHVAYHLMHRAGLRCATSTSTGIWSLIRTRAWTGPVAEKLDLVVQVTHFDRSSKRELI